MLRKYLFPLILIIISGCQTNPPDIFETVPVYTDIYIAANINGAEIFVDHITTGSFTPDTISISVGEHLISLEKNGYLRKDTLINVTEGTPVSINLMLAAANTQRLVLVEDFANVSCDPCVISNQIMHSLESYTYKDKIAVIKFPTYWPGANDPFYLHAKTEADARIRFYNIINAPTLIVDGVTKPQPQDSVKIKQAIDADMQKPVQFNINIVDSLTGDYLHADVYVTVLDTAGINFSQLVLHTAIIETEIEFASAPGSNGETKFYNVIRKMLPSPDGDALMNYDYEYHHALTCSPVWDKSKIKVIAFIQNKVTKEVYQAACNF